MADLVPEVVQVESEDDLDAQADAIAQSNEWGHPQTCPLHIAILKSPSGAIRMVWTAHHALNDAWSMQMVDARLREVYTSIAHGQSVSPTAHNVGFGQVAKYLESRNHDEDRAFWRNYMNGAERLQMLAGARASSKSEVRNQIETSHTGTAKLGQLAKKLNMPPSTIFLYSLAAALQLVTDQDDISFGLLLTGRTLPVPKVENIIGPCINTTLCRVMLKEDQSTRKALEELQAHLDEINERGYLGLVDIANAAQVDASAIANALAEYRNLPSSSDTKTTGTNHAFDGADVVGDDRVSAPIFISGGPDEAGLLRVNITADPSFISEVDAKWLAIHISNIASWIFSTEAEEKLSALNAIDSAEHDLIMDWALAPSQKSKAQETGTELLHEFIELQASRTPKKIAVQYDADDFMTYDDLVRTADAVAVLLQSHGIGPGSIVPICMEKCSALIAYIVAVLKAGAAFVPLDPANPWARRLWISKQVDASIVISSGRAAADPWADEGFTVLQPDTKAPAGDAARKPVRKSNPTDLAYIIFTSGSTGTPKGVMIRHDQVSAYIGAKESMSMEPPTSRRLHLSSTAFDASIGDTFGSLANGATSYLVNVSKMLIDFSGAADEGMVNRVFITPSVAKLLTGTQQPSWLRHLMLGGEGYGAGLRDALLKNFIVENVYGPTETVVTATSHFFSQGQSDSYIPLGRTIGSCTMYILKPGTEQLQPIGAIGELCIGGSQVGEGYLKEEEKTSAKFVADPFRPGGRMFRTGDLGRLHGDGKFECVGRMDGQIKIRGLRIETGEIEASIASNASVDQASVLKMKLADEVDRLVGFVVLRDGGATEELVPEPLDTELANQLWATMESKLPS
ncbi:hypothetical protein OC842_007796, partial [Tilletia horrida]